MRCCHYDNLSDDPAEEYFAHGITEDIITGLSAYHALRVIARNSSFTFKHQSKSVRQVGEALDVQYLVEGSVRKSGNQIRITARLVDVDSKIWSQRYDREFKDIFTIQDAVTNSVVAILPNRLRAADLARAKKKHTANMEAYDYVFVASIIIISSQPKTTRGPLNIWRRQSSLTRIMPRHLPGLPVSWGKEGPKAITRKTFVKKVWI